jgi:4-hydroxybenzoate polyprenyltransferase
LNSARPTARDYLDLFRPTQWVKNVVVLAGPAGGLKLFTVSGFTQAVIAMAAFCLAASGAYAINDVIDRETDARHPSKRLRPVARGVISAGQARTLGVLLILLSALITLFLSERLVTAVVLGYAALSLSYSLVFKRHMLLDVIVIALGFVLRAWAGSLAVGVPTSEWLVACMFTLCLFLGFGKRRCELATLGNAVEAGRHRATLVHYTPDLLNHLLTVSAGIAVMTFLLYTVDFSGPPSPFPKHHLFYTLPLVVYGVFRFAMVSELGLYSGPTEIVLKDRPLFFVILLWGAIALAIASEPVLFRRDFTSL